MIITEEGGALGGSSQEEAAVGTPYDSAQGRVFGSQCDFGTEEVRGLSVTRQRRAWWDPSVDTDPLLLTRIAPPLGIQTNSSSWPSVRRLFHLAPSMSTSSQN